MFDNESAFAFLKLTRTQRMYGFVAWLVSEMHLFVTSMPVPYSVFPGLAALCM
jgi:hypothetical protein